MIRMYLLVLLWSLLPLTLNAQSQFSQTFDNAFANVDKSGLSSGILYDRVFPAANLRESSEPSSAGHFQQAQAELYNASYNANNRLTPTDLKSMIWESQQRGIVPIGILLAEFQVLNTDAVELDGNNQYRLRNGYSNGQLYQTKQAVVASALSVSISTGMTLFQLPFWATYSHNNPGINSVTINFGDNSFTRTLTPGDETVAIYYGSPGAKTIQYTISLSDGTQRTALSTLTVTPSSGGSVTFGSGNNAITSAYREPYPSDEFGNIERLPIESDEAFQGYDESSATKGRGNAYIYYAQGRNGNNLRKPVIIVDGFDAGDLRGPNELYGEKLKYTTPAGDILLGDELRKNNSSYQSRPDYNSDLVLLNFPQYAYSSYSREVCVVYSGTHCVRTTTTQVPILRDGGADYIERNALSLVKLITIVNTRLQQSGSSEKITLIGPSMGGLISRYALRYMELRGMNANCKLWISFDSPHNGANIPIGGQQFLEYFANGLGIESAKSALNQQIDSPAAKQMLLHHYRNGEAVGGAPGFRDRFVGALNTFGYPQTACLRKVALNNGSKNGTLQPFNACQEGLYLNARLTNSGAATCFAVGLVTGIFAPILGGVIYGACAVGRDRILESRVYSAPSGSNRCLTFRKTLTSFGAGVAERYANGRDGNQPSNDTQPGGTYDVLGEIAEQARANNWFYQISVNSYFSQASFIPTVSSYGLYNTNRNWGASLTGINKTTETPFNDIYAPDNNEPHVLLTQAGVNFVRDQIGLANQQSCGGSLCNFTVSANTVNASCNQQVTLTATCSGANCDGVSYSWSGPNNFNASGASVNVTPMASNGSYQYTVTATRSGCANQTAIGTVNVSGCGGGTPPPTGGGDCQGFGSVCSGNDQEIRYVTLNVATAGNYPLTVTYTSHEKPIDALLRVGNAITPIHYNQTTYGVYTTATSTNSVYLSQGPNTIGLSSGSGGGYICFTNICTGSGTTPPPANCDFNLSASTANASCNQQGVQLSVSCSGANCDGVSYSWAGGQTGQTASFNAPGSNGNSTYTVTGSRSGCANKTANGTINVSGCGNPPGGGMACQTFGAVCSGNGQEIQYVTLNVATAGSYPLTISYTSHEKLVSTVVRVGSATVPVQYNQTSYGVYSTATTGSVYLSQGANTIGLSSGSAGGYVCFNNVCAGSGSGRLGASEPIEEDSRLVVLPNPSQGTVIVRYRLGAGETGRLSVVSMGGKELQGWAVMGTGDEQSERLELSNQASGLYLIRLEGRQSGSKTAKLILER